MTEMQLVLIRHGESQWNQENRFTGWVDVDLSEKGLTEARRAGQWLKAEGFAFDEAHTSILKRAIRTLWLTLDELDQMWLPVRRDWRLNERHYGALQGLNKAEMTAKFGEKQVHEWRRSFATPPPPLDDAAFAAQTKERRLVSVPPSSLPRCESLANCLSRVMPYWEEVLAPALKAGRRPLVVAHGNSLRALVKHLDQMSESAIAELNIPTGFPLLYRLGPDFRVLEKRYLGDAGAAEQAAKAVANQAKSKR